MKQVTEVLQLIAVITIMTWLGHDRGYYAGRRAILDETNSKRRECLAKFDQERSADEVHKIFKTTKPSYTQIKMYITYKIEECMND